MLEEARDKARSAERNALLSNKGPRQENKNKDRVPLIVTYNPGNPDLQKMLDKNLHLLQLCSKKEAFKEKPLI